MTEPKFTHATWVIDDCIDYIDIVDTDKNTIVVVENENRHNANLIAAAPDLYNVLSELEESYHYWSEYDVPLGIQDRITKALAKANGESF